MIRTLGLILVALLGSRLASGEVIDRIAAIVNDEVITLGDVRKAAAPALASLGSVTNPELRAQEERRALKQALDDLIGQTLLMQEATKLHMVVGPEEVDRYISQLKSQYGWDDQAMRQALEQEGTTLARFRKDVRRRLSTSRLVQMKLGPTIRVSEEEVTQALEREYRGLAREIQLTARHILLLVPEGATKEEEAKVAARAREILAMAREPGADFVSLAKKYSEGPSASRGGDIGSFTKGTLDPAFEEAAFAAEVGEIVGPVRTRYGYHIIQVTRRRELAPKDEAVLRREVRGRLRQERMERAMNRWIQELRRKAFVDVKLWRDVR